MPLFLQTSRSFVEHMNVYEAGVLTRKEISFDATVPQICVAIVDCIWHLERMLRVSGR
jgi:hypothetical protein